jgi:hypothetical protein
MVEIKRDTIRLNRMPASAAIASTMLTTIMGLSNVWKMFFIWFCLGVSEHKKASLNKEQG